MSKNANEKKYCNCPVSINKLILKSTINHSFCEKCGSILIKSSSGKINYTIKQKQKIKQVEFDPIEIIKSMKKKTDAEYPYLNNEYNMSDMDQYNKDKILKSINNYLKHRKSIILNLQKMMKMLDYSDLIFYQSLFHIDSYLSHNMHEEISEKEILYYLVGYFLCSAKLKETDIYEPILDSFCYIKKKIYLSMEKIAYYEIICLQSIKYNVFSYSAYDWLSELNIIGYVFDCEVNNNNAIILINGHRHSLINSIHKYALKKLLSITVKNIFIKYSPMYIAFSLMRLSREKFIDKEIINQKLFNKLTNLYGVNYTDYKKCYKELKEEIDDSPNENNDNLDKEIEKNEDEKKENTNLNTLNMGSSDKLIEIDSHGKVDKGVVVVNKTKSTTSINRIKASLFKAKEEYYSKNENNDINGENINIIDDKENANNNPIDENIIVFDENNDEKANINIESNLDINIKNDTNEDSNKNKFKSSNNLSNIKLKSKEHISINCTSVFKSNENLPKVDHFFDKSFQSQKNENKGEIKNNKLSSSKTINNHFLKSSLNPVKTRKSIAENSGTKNFFNSISSKNNTYYKSKEELDQMKLSLFHDNTSSKNQNNANGVVIPPLNKMKSGNITEDKSYNIIEKRNNRNNDNSNNIRTKYKSKGKSNNNLEGKETKTYVPNKRNQSTNQGKRRSTKTILDANNAQNNKNNIKIKNK